MAVVTEGGAVLPCSARLAEGLGVCKRREGCEKRAEGEGAEEPGLDERRAQSVCAALARSFEVLSLSLRRCQRNKHA